MVRAPGVTGVVAEGRLEELQVYKLLSCVREGDGAQVEKLVRMGLANLINMSEPRSGTGALHLASEANDQDLVRHLLALGACPNIQDKLGRTPVILAAQRGHDGMVALLAQNHANMNIVDSEGKGVLFYCISPTKRHGRCVQVALESQADVNNVSRSGKPVFLHACESAAECTAICLSILGRGADANATHQVTGGTVLMEAARAGVVELVRAILERGGDPNALDKRCQPAAHYATQGGFCEVLMVLSAYSADLSVMAADGSTALHYAAAGGFTECCRFLAQRGCNPKLKNQEGLVPRQIAKDNGHKAALKELKKAERLHAKLAKPGAVNPNEPWALRLHDWSVEREAVLRGAFETAEESMGSPQTVSRETFVAVLQEHRVPVDAENLQRVVAEHDKTGRGVVNLEDFFKGLKYLQKAFVLSSYTPKKKKKAGKGGRGKRRGRFVLPMPICTIPPELMARRGDGGPPYFMIESYQQVTDVKRFDRDRRPRHPVEDDSAWYMDKPRKVYENINHCVRTGDLESLCLAFSQGVPVDVIDRFYKTPLMTACSTGNYDVASFLVTLGASVHAVDQFQWTPLHHACHAGQLHILQLLVRCGAEVDARAHGVTPLMRAIESCRLACVDFLISAGASVQAENKKGQNCLDIARDYGDARVVDLLKAQLDRLPKAQDEQRGKAGKASQKARPTPPPERQQMESLSQVTSLSASRRAALRDSIIYITTHTPVTAGNQLDISFTPRTVWGNSLAGTQQYMDRRVERREQWSHEVDFKDFLMPFSRS